MIGKEPNNEAKAENQVRGHSGLLLESIEFSGGTFTEHLLCVSPSNFKEKQGRVPFIRCLRLGRDALHEDGHSIPY